MTAPVRNGKYENEHTENMSYPTHQLCYIFAYLFLKSANFKVFMSKLLEVEILFATVSGDNGPISQRFMIHSRVVEQTLRVTLSCRKLLAAHL